jgi:hypothetical protein
MTTNNIEVRNRIAEICKQLDRHHQIEQQLKRELRELMLKLKLKL